MDVRSANTISTEDKVRFLSGSDAYPHRPPRVEVVETHWSWVFLAGEHVYKLKKPVASEHIDFTRLTVRETNSRKEVRLNRRLAGDVYEGVARLALGPDGRLSIGSGGEAIDWLVVMRRLPADRMLDQMIARSAFDGPQLRRLGDLLATFYAGQPASKITPAAYLGRFKREQATNRRVLAACPGGLSPRYGALLDRLDAALVRKGSLLEGRVLSGHVVDGHGDLRPEHVCMTDPIIIFDCLEFSDELRQVEPVDELAFLGMECAMLGAAWIGSELIGQVPAQLGEPVQDELVALYTAYRALLRARLSLAHLLDPVPRNPDRWRPLADRYVAAADAALIKLGLESNASQRRTGGC